MDQLEKVEKLREKTGVSYEDAKLALEENNWDILEAVIYLEKQGKVKGPRTSSYTTNNHNNNNNNDNYDYYKEETYKSSGGDSFGEMLGNFFHWCGRVINKGNRNYLEISRDHEKPVNIPITVGALLLIFAFWVVVPLLIVGLFFGFRYSFQGPDMRGNGVNDFMDKASNTAENIKDDLKSGFDK